MSTIKYTFADGTASEIEVTDEFYTLYAEPVQQEKRNHWKEKRRHILLDYPNENGIDFASPAANRLSVLMQWKDKIEHIALSALSDEQKRLAKRCFATGRAKSRETKESGRGKCAEKLI